MIVVDGEFCSLQNVADVDDTQRHVGSGANAGRGAGAGRGRGRGAGRALLAPPPPAAAALRTALDATQR